MDEEAKRAIKDFNRIYNKSASGQSTGPKFIEIQDEFEFLKDLSLKDSAITDTESSVDVRTEPVNEPVPVASNEPVNDWLDDLLN